MKKTIDLISNSINVLKLDYTTVVNQDIEKGTFAVNEKHVSTAQSYFSNLGIKFSLLKNPRREDDAIIFLLETPKDKFCLKMLPDVWIATAEHLRRQGYISKMSKSKYLPKIRFFKLDTSNKSILYLYDYMEGLTLSEMVSKATVKQKTEILKTLKKCINDWVLNYNMDINFDDGLDNFIINPSDLSDIRITDINTAFQALNVVSKEDLLRMVKKRALRFFSGKGFGRMEVYNIVYKMEKSRSN